MVVLEGSREKQGPAEVCSSANRGRFQSTEKTTTGAVKKAEDLVGEVREELAPGAGGEGPGHGDVALQGEGHGGPGGAREAELHHREHPGHQVRPHPHLPT